MSIGPIYNFDMVCCVDATGANQPLITMLRQKLPSIRTYVEECLGEAVAPEQINVRVKIIAFRDYACDPEPMVESPFFTMPEDSEELSAFLGCIHAGGGGDIPESALEALAIALKSDFTKRTTENKVRHVIIMMTDAPAHELLSGEDNPAYPLGMPKDLNALRSWVEDGVPDKGASYNPRCGRIFLLAPNEAPWSEISEWNCTYFADITSFGCIDDEGDSFMNTVCKIAIR